MWYAKQKQFGTVNKGAAKQRINAIIEYNWQKQGLISSYGQADWNIVMINIRITTTGKNKDWYQVAAKWI